MQAYKYVSIYKKVYEKAYRKTPVKDISRKSPCEVCMALKL